MYVASTGKKLGSIFTGCSENSLLTKDVGRGRSSIWKKQGYQRLIESQFSMNGNILFETRSAVLCLVKGKTEIQVEKKKNCKLQYRAKVQSRDSSTMPCTNSKSHVLKVHAPDFFFPNHTKKLHWERLFTLK